VQTGLLLESSLAGAACDLDVPATQIGDQVLSHGLCWCRHSKELGSRDKSHMVHLSLEHEVLKICRPNATSLQNFMAQARYCANILDKNLHIELVLHSCIQT
jgi:hypothetical protein